MGAAVAAAAVLYGLPVLPSGTGVAHAASPAEPVTEQSASERAQLSGEPVEVTSMRTEHSQTVANPDGTFTLTQSTEAQRVQSGDGSWRDIDATLEKRPDGTVGPKATVVDLAFSGGGSGADMLRIGKDGQAVKLGWPGQLPPPVLEGPTATYPNVLDGVDLQLTATPEGYHEVLVVKTAEAAANPALEEVTLSATGEGLSVVPGAGGGLRAVDGDGNAVFRGPAGQMWDSTGGTKPDPQLKSRSAVSQSAPAEDSPEGERTQPEMGDVVAELPVTVAESSVSVEPDLDLLRGEETVYPVYIDPSVGLGASERTVLSSNGNKYWKFSGSKGVGRCYHADGIYCDSPTSNYANRMYFEFGSGNLAGKRVLDATFRAYETWSWNCEPHWVDLERTDNISEGTRWPGPRQLNQMGDRHVSAGRGDRCSPQQPARWIEFNDNPNESDENLTSTVRSLADGKISRLTLMLRAKDEGNPRAWKRFDDNAELKVWYVHRPGVPTKVGIIPGTGSTAQCRPASDPLTVTVDTPTVQASVQTKVEAHEGDEEGSLQAEFVMERSSDDTTSGSWSRVWSDYEPDSGWDPDGTVERTTTSKRADGGLYRMKARTQSHWFYNGNSGDLFSSYSSWCYLRIDSTAPKAPTITSSGPYTQCVAEDCAAHGAPGEPGNFVFSPNAADTDVKAYRWRLLTTEADGTERVDAATTNASVTVDVSPGLPGTQTLSVEASDLKPGKDGRVRWGPPGEFDFKVGAAPGATGRWRFDDGGPGSGLLVAKDTGEVGARHDATLRDEAGTGWSTLGRRGAGDYALRLNDNLSDPAQRIGFASTDSPTVNTQDSFTVSAWAYLTDASETRGVLSLPGQYASAFTLYYSAYYEKWVFNRADQDKNDPVYLRSLADDANPPLRVWTHLAGVFDTQGDADPGNDTLQLFVNGQPQGKPVVLADEASTYEPWSATGGLQMGRVNDISGQYFMGRLDEFATWQDARTPEQLREEFQLYRDGLPSNELVAHWDATISAGSEVVESPEDPDDPTSTSFPYHRGGMTLSPAGASLSGEDATALVLNGSSGYAKAAGPVVDETGSFTVSTRVRLNRQLLAAKPIGYRGMIAAQAIPGQSESSWALWVEKVDTDLYWWKFGRTAVDDTGAVTDSATLFADFPVEEHQWDTWVDLTGVFDAADDFTGGDGEQHFGTGRLYVGEFVQQPGTDSGLSTPQQGDGELIAGRGSADGTTGHYLPGDLAKLRIWVGAMTEDQVRTQIAEPST